MIKFLPKCWLIGPKIIPLKYRQSPFLRMVNLEDTPCLVLKCKKKEGGYGVEHHFQQYFSYIMMVSFIGGENRSTRENHRPVTDKKKKVTNLFNK